MLKGESYMSVIEAVKSWVAQARARLSAGSDMEDADLQASADTRPIIRAGIIVILVTFVGCGGWAAITPLSQGAVASGKIIVENQRKEIQHLEGGIVAELLARDGVRVEKGQTLIVLDNTRIKANVQIYEGQYLAAKAQEARLIAERDGLDEIVFPDNLLADLDSANVERALAGQRDQFEARKSALAGEQAILAQRVTQLQRMVSGLESQANAKGHQLKLLKEEIEGLRELYAKGHASKQRMLALEREASSVEGERGKNLADIAGAKLRIGETELEMIQNERDFRQTVVDELGKAQEEAADIEERLVASRDVLDHTIIRAPASGVVVSMDVSTVGAVLPPGKTILEIVPENQRLIVQAKAQAQDIDSLSIGAPAEVRILPFKQRLLPILMGTVISVSADSLEDERTGIPYYKITAEISEEEMAKLDGQILVPGMPADVIVKAGEYTALEYFLAPLSDSLARAFKE